MFTEVEPERKLYISNDFRTIKLPNSFVLGVYNDKNSHRVVFNMPRFFNGIDLSEYAIAINSLNAFAEEDKFVVSEIDVEENIIEFVWTVQRLMYLKAGEVIFTVCFRKVDNEGVILSEFNTASISVPVLDGVEVDNGGMIEDFEKDIFTQITRLRDEARQAALDARQSAQNAGASARAAHDSEDNASSSATLSESYAVGGTNSRQGEDTDNSKYYCEESEQYFNTIEQHYKTAQSYARGDALDSSGNAFRQGQESDNAKYYSEQAGSHDDEAFIHEQMAKSYATGNGLDSQNDPIRSGQATDNAKYYSEQSSSSADSSLSNARMSQSYAVGGALDDSNDPVRAYQDVDNAMYYKNKALEQANRAKAEANNAEAFSKGTREGVAVTSDDPAYEHNALFYAEKAAENGEAWARGTRNGIAVESSDEEYNNNAKYYAERAAHEVSLISTTFTGTRAEWDALTAEQQAEYVVVNITDDYEELAEFTGCTENTAGSRGLVPPPHAGIGNYALKADGTWGLADSNIFVGSIESWNALSNNEKAAYKLLMIEDSYTVTVSGDAHVSSIHMSPESVNGNTYTEGTVVTVTAEAEAGYEISSGTGVYTILSDITIAITSNKLPPLAIKFSSDEPFSVELNLDSGDPVTWDGTIEYSTDDGDTWTTWDGASSITGSANQPVYMRGTGNTVITDMGNNFFITDAKHCDGNIETLLDYQTVANGEHTVMGEGCFYSLFSGNSTLITVPALPATTLARACYGSMFANCIALTTPPALPATTLASGCYDNMFVNCVALTTAPELPATTLASGCYNCMFMGCTALTTPPALPATTLARECYTHMFDGAGLTTLPDLPATTLAEHCYDYMFNDCESIILYDTQSESYPYPYRIPTAGTLNGDLDSQGEYMFQGIGGDMQSVSKETTYYMEHEPISITV